MESHLWNDGAVNNGNKCCITLTVLNLTLSMVTLEEPLLVYRTVQFHTVRWKMRMSNSTIYLFGKGRCRITLENADEGQDLFRLSEDREPFVKRWGCESGSTPHPIPHHQLIVLFGFGLLFLPLLTLLVWLLLVSNPFCLQKPDLTLRWTFYTRRRLGKKCYPIPRRHEYEG